MLAIRMVVGAVAASLLALPFAAQAATPSLTLQPSAASVNVPTAAAGSRFVELKLRESADVTRRGKRFMSRAAHTAADLNDALTDLKTKAVRPLFDAGAARLSREADQLRSSGHPVPDLSQWYRLRFASPRAARRAAPRLAQLDGVAEAYVGPLPPPLPVTGDFERKQRYRQPSVVGIGDTGVGSIAGADGSAVTIIDVEYSWNLDHEDLTAARSGLIPNGTPCDPFDSTDHGTAVLGVLAAADDGRGVTGIVPEADIGVTNAAKETVGGCSWSPASAINVASAALSPGDVILIEQQTYGPDDQLVPVEWMASSYDAIKTATAQGIVVIEAAGNGSADLDDTAVFGDPFPQGKTDSGAIIVGAANACGWDARSRASFSTYGSRVNLQGWGECVATTGYGDLSGTTANDLYTSWFSGTSSASPIVAGSAAAVLSAHEVDTGTPMSPQDLRQSLISTGTPQLTGPDVRSGHIGPMPNLLAAIAGDSMPQRPENLKATGSKKGVRLTWSQPADSDVAGYDVYRSTSPWLTDFKKLDRISPAKPTFRDAKAKPGTTSYYQLATVDLSGQTSTRASARGIRTGPGVVQERAAKYRGPWKTNRCRCDSGGSTRYSSKPGASAKFRFTGSQITFVSKVAGNRGRVRITLDGKRQGVYSLNSYRPANAKEVWSKRFKKTGSHTLKLVVVNNGKQSRVDVDAFVVKR